MRWVSWEWTLALCLPWKPHVLTHVDMYGCRLPANERRNKNVLQGSLPLAFFLQVFLLLSAQQVPKWKARELQKWRSLTKAKVALCSPWGSHVPQSSCFWEQGLELIPVWANASVLAFPCLHLIKSKAENKPNLDGFNGSPTYLQIVLKHATSKRANYQDVEIKLKHSHAQNCCLAIRRPSKENQVSQN